MTKPTQVAYLTHVGCYDIVHGEIADERRLQYLKYLRSTRMKAWPSMGPGGSQGLMWSTGCRIA